MSVTTLLHPDEIDRVIERLASQVIERHDQCEGLVLLGIQRRGVDIARRLNIALENKLGHKLLECSLDINLYRDDWTTPLGKPVIGESFIPASLDSKDVLLVDDVLFTGRTIRAALEAILDYGRPRRVELLVLIDRGHRELPSHADYVGRTINTARDEQVNVLLHERDGKDEVTLERDRA
ncbi:MAG: bifunctional pyr operon transcriptional regulator/uracil phosphoribosyltransferase PyrR [Desulfovibrionaceae bacterium]|nr:bifunctional pyr operon transcriptional regulator/uracil phosphoribosyltransferase PyrR [Desulfovibrionaceae bacterium]